MQRDDRAEQQHILDDEEEEEEEEEVGRSPPFASTRGKLDGCAGSSVLGTLLFQFTSQERLLNISVRKWPLQSGRRELWA